MQGMEYEELTTIMVQAQKLAQARALEAIEADDAARKAG